MKASEILKQTGRSIAYRPKLAKLFGGVTAEIFFEQIFYWQDKAENNELGVYKTQSELEEETGLTRKEQETARKKLREIGILTETHKRLEHRIYFKINMEKLDELLSTLANVQSERSPMPERDIRDRPKSTFVNTLDYNTRLHTNIPPLSPIGESADAEDCVTEESLPKNKNPTLDYSAVFEVFNKIFADTPIPQIRVMSDERKRLVQRLAKLLKKQFGVCSVSAFADYFSDFLQQAQTRQDQFYFGGGKTGWVADFDYIMRPKT